MAARVSVLSGTASGKDAIVVFPHAGASPRFYAPWCQQLPSEITLYGVTYPGRDMLLDEPGPETLVDLARECAVALENLLRSASSVVIFGHSMGSYVAFEAIRSLERSGMMVTALVASGSDAPHLGTTARWHRASDDELIRHLGELDSQSREVFAVPELRRLLLPAVREDFRLVEGYRATLHPSLSCPIHIVNGEADPEVTTDRSAEWNLHTQAGGHTRLFPGGHFYLRAHTRQLVAELRSILASSAS